MKQLKIKHIIKVLRICCHTESDAIGNKTNALTLRQGLLVKQRIRSLQKERFSPKYIFCCSPENPLLPLGTLRTFCLTLSFHLSFPLLHLVKCQLEQISENTKTPFYSSHLKNNFLCHLFGLLFLGRRFPPPPGLDGPSLFSAESPCSL